MTWRILMMIVLLVPLTSLVSCASEPANPEDDMVIGAPPPPPAPKEPEVYATQSAPTDTCEQAFAADPIDGAKCLRKLELELLETRDRAYLDLFVDESQVNVQFVQSDGRVRLSQFTGREYQKTMLDRMQSRSFTDDDFRKLAADARSGDEPEFRIIEDGKVWMKHEFFVDGARNEVNQHIGLHEGRLKILNYNALVFLNN